MRKVAQILSNEPVVILSIATGVTAVLSKEHLIAPWITLAVLAVVTPIQRQLVTPESKLRKLGATVRKELRI